MVGKSHILDQSLGQNVAMRILTLSIDDFETPMIYRRSYPVVSVTYLPCTVRVNFGKATGGDGKEFLFEPLCDTRR